MVHNVESIRLTQESYLNTFQKLYKMFGSLNTCGTGYTYYIGERFETHSRNYKYANKVIIHIESLFDFSTPKQIRGRRVWSSDFFTIQLYRVVKFKIYHKEFQRIDESGNVVEPERLESNEQPINVSFYPLYFGLESWKKNKQKINDVSEKCQKHIQKTINENLVLAEKEFKRWKSEVKAMANI